MASYLVNSFSLNMLGEMESLCVDLHKVDLDGAMDFMGFSNPVVAISHEDLWRLLCAMGFSKFDKQNQGRVNVALEAHDRLLVAQYRGRRLEEGATELPDGATIEFWGVHILPSFEEVEERLRDDAARRTEKLRTEAEHDKLQISQLEDEVHRLRKRAEAAEYELGFTGRVSASDGDKPVGRGDLPDHLVPGKDADDSQYGAF